MMTVWVEAIWKTTQIQLSLSVPGVVGNPIHDSIAKFADPLREKTRNIARFATTYIRSESYA